MYLDFLSNFTMQCLKYAGVKREEVITRRIRSINTCVGIISRGMKNYAGVNYAGVKSRGSKSRGSNIKR